MQPCIATVSLSGDLQQKMTAAAAAGFEAIELIEQDLLASGLNVTSVRQLAADLGIEIAAFQPCRDIEGMPEPHRKAVFDRVARQLDIAASLGARMLLVCSAVSPVALADQGRAAADLAALADLTQARGLKVGYEALSWGTHVASHSSAWQIVQRADHPALGLVLDSFHSLVLDIPTDDIPAIPGDRIFLVQIADAPRLQMEIIRLSRHHRRLPGLGDLDLTRFIAAVEATGYAGPLSVEVFSDELRATEPVATARDAMLSFAGLRARQAPQRLGTKRIALPETFRTRRPVEAALRSLPSDRLRSLGVRLSIDQAQGSVRMMLDPQPDLAINGSRPAVEEVPLRGLFHKAGISGVDHLLVQGPPGASRRAKLGLSAALRLGWRDLPDLPDPDGPIHLSRLDTEAIRFLMATPATERADAHLPAEQQDSLDADLLCLATADILAASEALVDAGHKLLPVPQAHLDVSGAQLGLSDLLMAKLAAAEVFLDADDNGWFQQVFLARPFDGTVISVAQRCGSYAGYGLGNAAIWLSHRRRLDQNRR